MLHRKKLLALALTTALGAPALASAQTSTVVMYGKFYPEMIIGQAKGGTTNAADLATLVTDGYLRKVPVDPMTKSADTWVLAYEEASTDQPADQPATPGIVDIHSGSADKALDGTLYKDW